MASLRAGARSRRHVGTAGALAAAVMVASLVGSAPVATAAPTLTLPEAQAQLLALNRQAADAVEVLSGMKIRLQQLTAEVAARQARVRGAQAAAAKAGDAVDDLAREAYTGGVYGNVVQALGASSPEAFLDQVAQLSELGEAANRSLQATQDTSAVLATEQAGYDQDQAIMAEAVGAMAVQRRTIAADIAATTALISTLTAQEKARIAAEAEARREAEIAAARSATVGPVSFDTSVVTPEYAAKAQIAVQYMLSQVGGTYSMNAQPPSTWDCSKLTAYAWGQAGVSLVAYSFSQWGETVRVPQDQLQPGDLLFYFRDGAHHVEMYIGNGMAISASNPSVGVELQTAPFAGWYGAHYSGAGRVVLP